MYIILNTEENFCFPSLVSPGKLVELIRRDYKGAVLCPFPWCEDELQLKLSNIFTRLKMVSRTKERSQLKDNIVNMTEIFKSHPECHNPRVVLIEGNPGMGKTTYCQKLAYDWSVGEIPPDASFPEVNILLLLKCRDMHMKNANIEEAIDDQLLPHDANKREKEDLFHFIRSNQSRILLVLDGLDELREDLLEGFLPLIQGKVFSNVYLMLTARHEAGMKARRYCDTLLELVGYTKDDVENYIKKYFISHEDQSLADKMIQKLNGDRHLKELTANPLNTALLCLLCEETRGEFPSKRTKMYDDLVACALRRYFVKRGISLGDEDPVERCASELNQLGKMAFEALLKNQLYFTQDEMKSPPTVDFLRLPFLSREPSVSKIRPSPTYAFTHKTFQEYFAAFYLAHQLLSGDNGKESLRLDELSPIDNWQVWEFLITMVSSKNAEAAVTVVSRLCAFFYLNRLDAENDEVILDAKIFESDPHDWTKYITTLSENEETLMHVVCDTLDVIAKCEDGDNELKDYQKKLVRVVAHCFPLKKLKFTLYDDGESTFSVFSEYLKFNYSLTDLMLDSALDPLLLRTIEHIFHSKKKLVHFNLKDIFLAMDCYSRSRESFLWMQSVGIKTLLAEVSQSGCVLTHLNLYDVWIGDEGVQALAEFLETNRTLSHVNIHNAMITDSGATALGKALQLNNTLTHLSLPRNRLSGVGAKALATSLKSNSVLIFFDLSKNLCGGDSVAIALSKAVKSNCSLQYLNLSLELGSKLKDLSKISELFRFLDERSQMIGPRGGSALARALCFNCTLTYLDLSRNNINNSGAAALGDALLTNRTLTELYLEDNNIGKIGVVALGKALESNRTLTHLNLHGNRGIGNSGAAAIAKALWSNDSFGLTRLDLSGCQIRCSGASRIADALQTNCSLTHLGWSCNEVKSSGASAFARALKSNRTLTHLDLSSNSISDSGATELAQALHIHNNTLAYLDLTENHSIGSGGREGLAQVDQSKCIVKYNGRQ